MIPRHAREQIEGRGISLDSVENAAEKGELFFSETNHRFGTKKYSLLKVGEDTLVVVWFWNKNREKEVVTAYWRKRRREWKA